MKLLTKKIEEAFEKQGDTSQLSAKDIPIVCKLFVASATWYLYERLDEDTFMCFADLGDPMLAELGSVSLAELESIKVGGIFPVERDMYYTIETLQDVIDRVKSF